MQTNIKNGLQLNIQNQSTGLRTLEIQQVPQVQIQQQQVQKAILLPDGTMKVPQHEHKFYQHALRVYVGNIPDSVDQKQIETFISDSLKLCGGCLDPGVPIFSGKLNMAKKFIFLTMRSIEEASALLELDGLIYQGKSLRIRRPTDYATNKKVIGMREVPILDLTKIQIQKISTQVENTPDKLWITNIPEQYNEQQIIDILQQFGQLKSFHLAADKVTNQSKGFAFCEFQNTQQTDYCIQQMNGKILEGRAIQIKRSINNDQISAMDGNSIDYDKYTENFILTYKEQFLGLNNQFNMLNNQKSQQQQQQQPTTLYNYDKLKQMSQNSTAIIRVSNIIDKEQIEQEKEYKAVFEDIKQQFQKVGQINQIIIPRIKDGYEADGIGNIYIEYIDEGHAQIAKFAIEDMEFDNKKVQIEFYDARKFADQIYI
ncbi:hypothetical protein PPERSA_05015 [Pseudocohnilembus persalinus]|uniref:RRM domain-containing protein n=1 Tax=Pseudocohnilembus persalinus TaxID=266149 RepID=A0A0V0QW08_PSEPJ|nr:hypothetical protein PPERSA_05015 [Pseudocohnilembus persalinus]|eukprot:KRX06402.1 hypothetical protein PPERSA_05015 [Pseudocohnilembus persalinus]